MAFYFIPIVVDVYESTYTIAFSWDLHRILEGFPFLFGMFFVLTSPMVLGLMAVALALFAAKNPARLVFTIGVGLLFLIFLEWGMILSMYIQTVNIQAMNASLHLFILPLLLYLLCVCILPLLIWLYRRDQLSEKGLLIFKGLGGYLILFALFLCATAIIQVFPGYLFIKWVNPFQDILIMAFLGILVGIGFLSFFVPRNAVTWRYLYWGLVGFAFLIPLLLIIIGWIQGSGILPLFNPLTNTLVVVHVFGSFYLVLFCLYRGYIGLRVQKGKLIQESPSS
jgi:hypothetical protein